MVSQPGERHAQYVLLFYAFTLQIASFDDSKIFCQPVLVKDLAYENGGL